MASRAETAETTGKGARAPVPIPLLPRLLYRPILLDTMRRSLILTVALFAFVLTACDSFTGDVREPNDEVNVDELTTPTDVEFLATGVRAAWADAYGEITSVSSLLSDQFRFGRNGDATFPTFRDIDEGLIGQDNNSNDAVNQFLGEYRRLADDLITATNNAEFGESPPIEPNDALFIANIHGANARFLYAAYMGNGPREPGGVINAGEFIPSPAMYDSARVKFERARELAGGERQQKFVNSAEARSALYAGTEFGPSTGGYENALARAAELTREQPVLGQGDEPIEVLYSTQEPNPWFNDGGPGRTQIVAQDGELNEGVNTYRDPSAVRSFADITENNPTELNRVPLAGMNEDGAFGVDEGAIEFAQAKFLERSSPITYLSWQEIYLIRAELEVRGFDAGSESALALVNAVRASFELSDLSSLGGTETAQLETIVQERDRTLFALGQRLIDQRRFDNDILDWHLVDEFQTRTTFQHLPLNADEENANPNL